MPDKHDDAQLLPAGPTHKRYHRSKPWLERLLRNDPSFPRPIYIGKNRYWHLDQLIEWERQCAADSSARLPARGIAARRKRAAQREATP